MRKCDPPTIFNSIQSYVFKDKEEGGGEHAAHHPAGLLKHEEI